MTSSRRVISLPSVLTLDLSIIFFKLDHYISMIATLNYKYGIPQDKNALEELQSPTTKELMQSFLFMIANQVNLSKMSYPTGWNRPNSIHHRKEYTALSINVMMEIPPLFLRSSFSFYSRTKLPSSRSVLRLALTLLNLSFQLLNKSWKRSLKLTPVRM